MTGFSPITAIMQVVQDDEIEGACMKSLLTVFEASIGKTAYQSYTLMHGIEKIILLIPLKESKVFEDEFSGTKNKTKAIILEMVTRHSGKIKG